MARFLAWIDPVVGGGGGTPEHPIVLPPERPPGTWGGAGEPMPTPPIVIPPDALGPGVPAHPIEIPVYPAHPIVIPPDLIAPGVPTHPIYIPPGIWGGSGTPMPTPPIVIPEPPGGGPPVVIWPSPGHPAHPIVLPLPPIDAGAHPEHPIVLPPQEPPGMWGGAGEGFPTPPIVIPPLEDKPEGEKKFEWHVVDTGPDNSGWVVVGVPQFPHPSPSYKK